MSERRPFHKTIVDTIRSLTSPATEGAIIKLVADQIKQTTIPKNHDEIIREWQALMLRTCRLDSLGVVEDVREQKLEAEAEAQAKKEKAEAEARRQEAVENRLMIEDALER